MYLLGLEKAGVEFPTKRVFSGVSLGVNTGDRIGIVGRNGDGKSTLLNLLAGSLDPDEGRRLATRGVSVGQLGQSDALDPSHTVQQAVVGEMPEYEWAGSARVRSIIAGLLRDVPWDARVGELSGGQRRRVDLARLLVGDWDVLALDEPTNHLDIRAISWLANHLKNRWRPGQGALLVVTHDRWFLDEVCLSMWEVQGGRIVPFEGGFSAYILQRVERERLENLAEQKRRNLLRRELAWLSRGARARATKPKFHVATAQALIADVPPLRDTLELKRMACARQGKDVVELKGVSVAFGENEILREVDWILGPGDRYGIVGQNGKGKTTLLRTLMGRQELTAGRVKIGKTVRFSLLSQHLDELNVFGTDRVREVVGRYTRRTMLDGREVTPGQLLENLGFTSRDLNEPVCDLSGGQKRRLALMLILLDEPNVLVLDEPGNDLDIDMLAAVEDLLDGWPGTLVLVTHDRYLMERVTDDQFAIVDGRLRNLPGGVDEYLRIVEAEGSGERGGADAFREVVGAGATGAGTGPEQGGEALGASAGADTMGRAAKPRVSGGEIRALRKTAEQAERKLETQRAKLGQAREKLADTDPTDYEALVAAQAEIDAIQDRIDELELAWLEAAEALEQL